jgi:hypothetical protein
MKETIIKGKCCGKKIKIYNNGYWNPSELFNLWHYSILCPSCGEKIKLKFKSKEVR